MAEDELLRRWSKRLTDENAEAQKAARTASASFYDRNVNIVGQPRVLGASENGEKMAVSAAMVAIRLPGTPDAH